MRVLAATPLAERRLARRVLPTFEEAAKSVHASQAATFKNVKHGKQWLASLTYVFPTIGNMRVDAITSADILTALTPRWVERPETSRRVLQRVRVVFDWCIAKGYCGLNPTEGVTRALPKQRGVRAHHAALPYPQVPEFIRLLRASDASEVVKSAFEFTILCATRTSETLGATWDECGYSLYSSPYYRLWWRFFFRPRIPLTIAA